MRLSPIPFITTALLLAAAAMLPLRVQAQPTDHLICYTLKKDALDLPKSPAVTADLLANLQPDFTQRRCTIVKPVEFCVPAAKSNVLNPPAPLLNVSGQTLTDDYICYLIKCADPAPISARRVEDQFGARLQQTNKPFTMCVPASKLKPSCDQSTYPRCGGTCDDGSLCHADKTTKMCTCGGTGTCDGSKPDALGQCVQDCPAGQVCKTELATTGPPLCHCVDLPPPPCDGSVPQTAANGDLTCGERSCPANRRCVVTGTPPECVCQPVEPGCNGSTAAECAAGMCTEPGFICTLVGTQCSCQPPPQPCAPNALAGGACPVNAACQPGTTCQFVPSAAGGAGGSCQCK